MRQLKASDFATDREYKQAQREMRKASSSKRQGREARRATETAE